MAAWDDIVELYCCFENMDKDNPPNGVTLWILPPAVWSACLWKRNSTLHGMMMPRCTRWTMPAVKAHHPAGPYHERGKLYQPAGTDHKWYGAGDKWVIHRIVSPSPLPSNVDGMSTMPFSELRV